MDSSIAWSQLVQSPKTLDYYRLLRFQNHRQTEIINAFGLKTGRVIADIGCGPGTLSLKLAEWLSDSTKVIGIDRDTNFIEYAKNQAMAKQKTNVSYQTGDALNLPLADSSVDHAISYTVIEHLPHENFLREQIRICKNGGRIAVGFVKSDRCFSRSNGILPLPSSQELQLWQKLAADSSDHDKNLRVAAFPPEETTLIALMEKLCLTDIQFNALALPVFLDDGRVSESEKKMFLELEYAQNIESAVIMQKNGQKLTSAEFSELNELLETRFAAKNELIHANCKSRDYSVNISVIITGTVVK